MLKQLCIRGFAVVDELDLEFKPGMTVLTGETGAGKSILIDALGLILGDRADSTVIREGAERTEISAIFDIENNTNITTMLDVQAIQMEGNELLIRRLIGRDGRSRAFINNSPTTAQTLRDIGEYLIDIHGQHAHQSLNKRDVQRNLLDDFGNYSKQLTAVATAYVNWYDATTRLQVLTDHDNQDATLSLLRYQVQELENLQPVEGEYDELDEEHRRLSNANRLLETVQQASATLGDDEYSVYNRLNTVIADLQACHQFDESLTGISKLLDNASIQLSEASIEVRSYLDRLVYDPERLQVVEKRLSDLHDMARKHTIQTQQLSTLLSNLQQQLDDIENSQQLISELEQLKSLAREQYDETAVKLHQYRTRAAAKMSDAITHKLKALGMVEGQFRVSVNNDNNSDPKPNGSDQIEFLVNTNPGQAMQALRKIASGGELSRISLAIQVINSNDKGIPTLVFDEVDAGIGGGIAEIVGKLLHELSRQRQVFCVTHLAQVASQGDQHLQVEKNIRNNTTKTRVNELNADARIEEIARMLGGLTITAQSRNHAREILKYSSVE